MRIITDIDELLVSAWPRHLELLSKVVFEPLSQVAT